MDLSGMQMSLSVENGAAHIRLVRTHREESPCVEALQRVNSRSHDLSSPQGSPNGPGSPRSLHSMTLRSQTRSSLTPAPSPESSADVDLPNHSIHIRAPGRGKQTMTPHATPVTPESDASAPPANAGSPSPEAHQPHMNLSSTPSRSRFRAWDLNSPPRFVIWEDSPQRGSQICPTGHVFESIRSDDKENVYTTVMDYDTEPESESQTVGTDEMRLPAGPRDVLGMPITSIFGPTLLQHSQGTDATPSAQPTPVENNARLTMQVALREEDEMDMEWNDGPSPHEGEELARVNDTINRGAEQRWQYERGSPVRDHNVQRQRRHFLEVRRTAHSRRHQDRRRRFTGAGSPR